MKLGKPIGGDRATHRQSMKTTPKNLIGLTLLLPLVGTLGGCTRDHEFQPVDMWNGTRLKPYEAIDTPAGTTARAMPAGAIARGQLREDTALFEGRTGGRLVTAFPIAVNEGVLKRGQERYTIYCAPCHGGLGDGKGLIITRGFAKPPDYYADKRVLNSPIGHYYDVITHGYGAMYSYADRIPVRDRWAIVAYIRLLQEARKEGKNTGPILPGGGVYSPELKRTQPEVLHHGSHSAGGAPEGDEHTPPPRGGAPGSFIPGKDETSDKASTPGSQHSGDQH